MWERTKLLLAAIIVTILTKKGAPEKTKHLDMFPHAVDDMYTGCRKEAMEKFIHSGLLRQELGNSSQSLQRAWKGGLQCSHLIPGGTKEHTAAILAFLEGDFYGTVNEAVETLGVNMSTYEDQFHFKSLHFLLMDSMALLKPTCKSFYIMPEVKYTAQVGAEVRLGGFTSVSSNYDAFKKINNFDGEVVLNITSCLFAELGNNNCSVYKDAALLSPAEVFTVQHSKTITDSEDTEYTEMVLTHSRLDSSHNCYIFSRSPVDVSAQWPVLMLLALALVFFDC